MTANTGERDYRKERDYPEGPGDVPADTFAARLVLARHHAGRLSIEKAAERCDLNPGNWAHWESGRRPLDKVEICQAVARGLEINFNWLLLGGPLLPAEGRSTKRPRGVTLRYSGRTTRPIVTCPNGLTRASEAARPPRRPQVIRRSQPVAAQT